MKISLNNTNNIQLSTNNNVSTKDTKTINNQKIVTAKSLNFSGALNSIDIQNQTIAEEKVFNDFISKQGKVTLAEAEDIFKNNPRTLNKCYEICTQQGLWTKPIDNAKFAISLKNHFDDLYGKDNYFIVSIGTSPSPICETIQHIGANTIFLPATGLGRLNKYIQDNSIEGKIQDNFPNVKALMDYVDSKGIKNTDKHIVLLDYTNGGTSLKTMEKIFLEREDSQEDKIHRCSLIDVLTDISQNQQTENPWNLDSKNINNLNFDVSLCKAERVSNVPHFEVNHTSKSCEDDNSYITGFIGPSKELFEAFDNYSQPNARAWTLCSLNEARKLLK